MKVSHLTLVAARLHYIDLSTRSAAENQQERDLTNPRTVQRRSISFHFRHQPELPTRTAQSPMHAEDLPPKLGPGGKCLFVSTNSTLPRALMRVVFPRRDTRPFGPDIAIIGDFC